MKRWWVVAVVVAFLAVAEFAQAQTTTTSTVVTTTSTSSTTTTSLPGANVAVVSGLERHVFGDIRAHFGTVTMSVGYGPGGDAYTPAEWGLTQIDKVSCDQVLPTAAVAAVSVDNANKKIRAWASVDTPTEVTANTDLSAISFRCTAYGR